MPNPRFFVFCRAVCRLVCRLAFRLETHGRDHTPAQGGFLLVSNHASNLDPPLVGCFLRPHMHSLAKSELFRIPGFAWLLRAVNAHPIRRQGVDRKAMRLCAELVRSGQMLLVFPEGTRTRDGQLQPGKPGVAMIAVQAGVPCVPAYIDGSYRAWPRHRLLPRPAKTRVFYGEPFDLPERAEGMTTREHYQLCADEMMRRIAQLRPADPD